MVAKMAKKRFIWVTIASALVVALAVSAFVANATSQLGTTKAEYLARRVLLDPTPADVARLSSASSVADAVNMLLATPPAADTAAYQSGLKALDATASSYPNPVAFAEVAYTYQLVHDPNQARLKLYYLWENVFSVDAQDKDEGITYSDVGALHNILYTDATGSYLTMLENVQTNYALDRYLNLTQSKAASPNENFARELMQLFMMGASTPLDPSDAHPNYTETDVNQLAHILTGYAGTPSHQIVFRAAQHYTGPTSFLGSAFNDPAHVIQYIASKRSQQMSLFLASKLMHYYVSDTPSDADLSALASVIVKNNFQILPSLTWLLSSDIMFRPQYMQADRDKTPLELVASYYSALYGRSDYSATPNGTVLAALNFAPYLPGSVFGRDGFNSNALFYSGTILNSWVSSNYRLVHSIGQVLPPNIAALKQSATTPEQFVSALSAQLYLGATLPTATQRQLVDYLGVGMADSKILDVVSLMLDQPEFLAQGGKLQAAAIPATNETSTSSSPKLVVVRLRGGLDYQQLVANTSDPAYAADRGSLALTPATSHPLGNGYVLNDVASALLPDVTSGQASFINAVGLPGQIRAHDIASRQMETGLASDGILANLQKADPSRALISLSATPPTMMTGTSSLQIGAGNQSLFPRVAGSTAATGIRTAFTALMNSRSFPATLSRYYGQAIFLDTLEAGSAGQTPAGGATARTNHAASGTAQQFSELSSLMDQNIGNTYYLAANGSYDDHAAEAARFDPMAKDLFTSLANFYATESAKEKLTVVVFSEFGRTDKVNGSGGTDHGVAGGMVVLSNSTKLPTMLGGLHPSADANDWTDTQIDERDVWSTLFQQLYGVPQTALFGRSTTLASARVTIP
jgi:uncharacterized protein (DUF1800 family)/uncharacterized protein (DUF1501 family)